MGQASAVSSGVTADYKRTVYQQVWRQSTGETLTAVASHNVQGASDEGNSMLVAGRRPLGSANVGGCPAALHGRVSQGALLFAALRGRSRRGRVLLQIRAPGQHPPVRLQNSRTFMPCMVDE